MPASGGTLSRPGSDIWDCFTFRTPLKVTCQLINIEVAAKRADSLAGDRAPSGELARPVGAATIVQDDLDALLKVSFGGMSVIQSVIPRISHRERIFVLATNSLGSDLGPFAAWKLPSRPHIVRTV